MAKKTSCNGGARSSGRHQPVYDVRFSGLGDLTASELDGLVADVKKRCDQSALAGRRAVHWFYRQILGVLDDEHVRRWLESVQGRLNEKNAMQLYQEYLRERARSRDQTAWSWPGPEASSPAERHSRAKPAAA